MSSNYNKYSKLIYIPMNSKVYDFKIEEFSNSLIDEWRKGTKIILITNSDYILKMMKETFIEKLGYLVEYEDFRQGTFNFSFIKYYGEKNIEFFEIENGELNVYFEDLKELDLKSSFNLNQFLVEHCKINENIEIKAGAGSGKTYSMVSRIAYLVYKHKYSYKDFVEKISLITFTNEAANNMKERLRTYFLNMYLLTTDYKFLELVDNIDLANICTIHSLAKKIINKFSYIVDMGIDSKITTGNFQKEELIKELLENYAKENFKDKDIHDVFGYRVFALIKVISDILEKLEQKSILLNDGYNFGNNTEIDKLFNKVIPKLQEKLMENSIEDDKVILSHLIIMIKQILLNDSKKAISKIKLDYLFIDEFQDTDNAQIELLCNFRENIGFSFFIVGDIKQCIYRFRGAEENAFEYIKSIVKNEWNEFKLTKNYRTDKKLLERFNPIFENMGKVNILNYNSSEKLIGIKELNKDSEIYFERINYYENFSDELIDKVKFEKEALEKLDKSSKIAILVRRNSEVESIKNIFNDYGIKITTKESKSIYTIESTIDFYKLILALKYSDDPKSLYNFLNTNYVEKKINKYELLKRKNDTEALLKYLNDNNTIGDKWNEYLNNLNKFPVMKVLKDIINDLEPWKNFSKDIKDESESRRKALYYKRNLEQLLEIIINASDSDYISLNKIENLLKIRILSKTKEDCREDLIEKLDSKVEIICTTVHKSKGLEYDIVIIPYAFRNMKIKNDVGSVEIIVINKEIGYSLAKDEREKSFERIENEFYKKLKTDEYLYKTNEEARILYVAMTRAIKKFIYLYKVHENNKENDSKKFVIQEILSIK